MNAVMQTRHGQCFQWVTFKRADKVSGQVRVMLSNRLI